MKPTTNAAWTDAVRGLGKASSLEDLQRRGVRSVMSVSVSQVAAIIEQAVNETVAERTPDFDPQQRRALVHAATQRTLRLMRLQREILSRRERLARYREELAGEQERVASGEVGPLGDDIVERRLRKVTAYLDETDRAIHAALRAIEALLPFTHRRSEGVAEDDPQRDCKQQMLTQVFHSNELLHGPGSKDEAKE